jgi:hypothetical protein
MKCYNVSFIQGRGAPLTGHAAIAARPLQEERGVESSAQEAKIGSEPGNEISAKKQSARMSSRTPLSMSARPLLAGCHIPD